MMIRFRRYKQSLLRRNRPEMKPGRPILPSVLPTSMQSVNDGLYVLPPSIVAIFIYYGPISSKTAFAVTITLD
jgi:hypothetical protein